MIPELFLQTVALDVPLSSTPVTEVLTDAIEPGALARIVLDSLSKAGLYITIAVGLTLIFGLMGVLNFAHGSFAMYGAYIGGVIMVVAVTSGTGDFSRLAIFFGSAAFVLALMTVVGGAIEKKLIRPVYDRPPLFQILLTFGIVLVLDEAARIVVEWRGITPRSRWEGPFDTLPAFLSARYDVFGSTIRGIWLFEIAVGAVIVLGVYLFLTRTRYGLYIRAGSEDGEMAQALGIDIRQAFTLVFGVGTGLAALAGVILMWDPRFGASVPLTIEALLIAFVIVIIGGLGTFKGTVVAGVLVGFIDGFTTWMLPNYDAVEFALVSAVLPGEWAIPMSSNLPEATMFLALVVVLILRPQGLYGIEEVGGH